MSWVRKNSFISMVLGMALLIIVIGIGTNEEIEQTQSIYIQQGDTLWSLADEYRGKMSKQQWVGYVESLNQVHATKIEAGSEIQIPITVDIESIDQFEENVKVAKK